MTSDRKPPTLRRLRKAAAGLLPIEREVLILSAAEGLRIDEIAARLGISMAAAERHLAEALCKLDRGLERQERPWWRFW